MSQLLLLAGFTIWLARNPRRPKQSLLWSVIFFTADLVAIPVILRAKPPISDAELELLQPEHIQGIDRIALQLPIETREAIRKSSDQLLRTMVAVPLLFLFCQKHRERALAWLQDYVWGHALTYTIYTFSPLGPAFVDKFRPVVYRAEVPMEERSRGNNRNSQYSGHTGNAAFAAFFAARSLPQFREADPKSKAAAYGLAALAALLLGRLRIRAQKHFPSDVVLATGIGAFVALSTPLQEE